MKYSSNFEEAVVKYEPWAVMSVAQKIYIFIIYKDRCVGKG